MAALNRFTGAGVQYGLTAIAGIVEDSVKIAPNLQKLIARYDGNQNPTFVGTTGSEPVYEFETRDITFGTAPILINSTNPFVAYLRAYEDDGGMSASYISLTISDGLLVPKVLSGSAGQAATTTWEVHAVSSDGTTTPVIVGTASLIQIAHGASYCIATASLGTAVDEITGMTINFGYTVAKNTGVNGQVFPTYAAIEKAETTIDIETNSVSEATQDRINTGEKVNSAIVFTFNELQEGAIPTTGALTATLAKCIAEVTNLGHGHPGSASITAIAVEDTTYIVFS